MNVDGREGDVGGGSLREQVLWLALHDIAAAEGENFVEHKELRRIAREALAVYEASRGSTP
jgi:hypothetical protein